MQGEIRECDGKNGLSALCWSAQRSEIEWVQNVSTDQVLLNLRQDVWLVCCRNSPPSKPYIVHRISWAVGWMCLENVTKTQQFFWFHSPWSNRYTAWAIRLGGQESGFRYNSSILRQWLLFRYSEFSAAVSLKRRKWRHYCIKNWDVTCIFFRKLFLCVIQNLYSSLARMWR